MRDFQDGVVRKIANATEVKRVNSEQASAENLPIQVNAVYATNLCIRVKRLGNLDVVHRHGLSIVTSCVLKLRAEHLDSLPAVKQLYSCVSHIFCVLYR